MDRHEQQQQQQQQQQSLILTNAGLYDIPYLYNRDDINALYLDNNFISMLWFSMFPNKLEILDCSHNEIISDGLPFNWPNSLIELILDYNNIRDTFDVQEWPPNLKILRLSNNPLTKVPRGLSSSLHSLTLQETAIKIVEHIPDSVEYLDLRSSCVEKIYKLPKNLQKCLLSKNYLSASSSLADVTWPPNLRVLDLSNNFLVEFPKNLPDSLEHLNLANNMIEEIPERLPLRLNTLILRNNRIRNVQTQLLVGQHIIVFSLTNNMLVEIPVCIRQTNGIEQIQQCDMYGNFLDYEHHLSASMFQITYRRYIARMRLRTWRKNALIREELISIAMHPCRIDNIGIDTQCLLF